MKENREYALAPKARASRGSEDMPLVDFANLAQLLNGVRLLAYVSNLQKRFTETRLEDVDLFKTQPLQELCLYGPRKSKPRVKCGLRKQQ